MTMRDPNQAWMKLSDMFQAVSKAIIDSKLSNIQNIKMEHSESVMAYAHRIEGLVNELLSIGHVVCNTEKKRTLLLGLISDFTISAQVIRSTRRTFTEALAELIVQESSAEHSKHQQAFMVKTMRQVKSHGAIISCTHCSRRGHDAQLYWHNPRSKAYRKQRAHRTK